MDTTLTMLGFLMVDGQLMLKLIQNEPIYMTEVWRTKERAAPAILDLSSASSSSC